MPADWGDRDVLIREEPLRGLFGLGAAQVLPIEDDGKLSDMLLDRPTRFRTNHYCYSFNHLHSPSSRALHHGLFSLVKPKAQCMDRTNNPVGGPLFRDRSFRTLRVYGALIRASTHHPNMGCLSDPEKRHGPGIFATITKIATTTQRNY
ncbi:hypothetical protein [Cupriavidus alkaliphilus]|uniref:Uncharacterized protein n=2 Tax=Cupriavidus alkaliphilus TaxID=942866 RepID=A0A7W4YQQ8_9BURK|nr:hypothetical protein [Cupriavidus alkaliphilus]MBB3007184.1 hypothetical protein [Cupriavidus alkaliphilus]